MSDPILRPARQDDLPALIRICLDARTSADIPNLHTDAENRRFFGNMVETKKVMVAERGGMPVGFAVVHDGWLEHLWIDPPHHRQGIGGRLLAWARAEVPGDLHLHVFTHNTRAIAFYKAHDAVQIAATDGDGNEEKLPDQTLVIAHA